MCRYTGGRRPKTGDKIEVFKKFVEDCYERQMFKSSTPYAPSESPKTLTLSEVQGLSESGGDALIFFKTTDMIV
jgi:hypothetical protein